MKIRQGSNKIILSSRIRNTNFDVRKFRGKNGYVRKVWLINQKDVKGFVVVIFHDAIAITMCIYSKTAVV